MATDSHSGYGVRCAVDIFHFLCSLLNVVQVVEDRRVCNTESSFYEDLQFTSKKVAAVKHYKFSEATIIYNGSLKFEHRPFWEEKSKDDLDLKTWVEHSRVRRTQKRKLLIARDHFNRDEKKGLSTETLSISLRSGRSKRYCYVLRYTPELDKNMIGDYLGDS
ncbi:hypothetical protein OIU77_006048 [Salix suchowensis]|uniref:SEC7 domain-containing protein n=1 Tax=Salix suchowensis TaxID=1278906 RepID=A0ABQ9ARJ9_9ROSI|nr:hypothetical protein OIU77_006048 [Salix suchowensis]